MVCPTEGTTTPELMTWNDLYSVGIGSIDSQHRQLFRLVNDLNAVMMGPCEFGETEKALDRLSASSAAHFAHEESLMQTYGCPDFRRHKEEHDDLMDQVKSLRRDLLSGYVPLELITAFLKDWLLNHIIAVDKTSSAVLRAAGLA